MCEEFVQFFVAIEPKPFFNFRLKLNSNGAKAILYGKNKDNKSYPTVKLIMRNYRNTQYYVNCSLYEAHSAINSNNFNLSGHLLVEQGEKNDSKYYRPISKLMHKISKTTNDTTELICQFKDCFIVKTIKKNYKITVKKKCAAFEKWPSKDLIKNRTEVEKLKVNDKREKCVCLGFTLFEKYGDQYKWVNGPIFSECMTNGEEIILEKLCTTYGTMDGGEEVTLIMSGIKKNDIAVQIYEKDENDQAVWKLTVEDGITFITENIITFRTPKYGQDWPSETTYEIDCRIEVIRKSDNRPSKAVSFTYRNLRAKRFHKAKFDGENPNCPINVKAFCKEIDEMPPNGSIPNHYFKPLDERGNTFFHIAIRSNEFQRIYSSCKSRSYHHLFTKITNFYGENLLHYACLLDKPHYIYPLIELGCDIWTEDSSDRTPLYIAIEQEHNNCIEKFREIFRNPKNYPSKIADIQKSLKCYDAYSYTALHFAITKNLKGLVEDMLRFCVETGVNLRDMEVLGNGDRILHLAVTKGLPDMAKIIMEVVPDAYLYDNYGGESPYNMKINSLSMSYKSSKCIIKMINQMWEQKQLTDRRL